jgi:hypothetical protein
MLTPNVLSPTIVYPAPSENFCGKPNVILCRRDLRFALSRSSAQLSYA